VAATVAAAAIVGAPPARASQVRVEFDDEAADLVTVAFERGEASPRLVDEIVRTGGYELMFAHVAASSRRDPEDVRAEFRAALDSSLAGEEEPGFRLDLVRTRFGRYRQTLRELRRVSGTLRWKVTDRLNGFLPPMSDISSTAYLVVGGDASGLAFGHRDDIALRLDDFVPASAASDLDTDRLASVLTHELFHVGFRAAGGLPPRPARPDEAYGKLVTKYGAEVVGEVWRASGLRTWDGPGVAARFDAWVPPAEWDLQALDRFLAMLVRLQNEGCAVYVDAPLRDPGATRRHAGEVARWMESIDSDMDYLAMVTTRLSRGADPLEIAELAVRGFENNGPLYRVGYHMAERIDTYAGRRPFLATIRHGALEFFETYFQTHPYGPGQIDSRTEDEIERLIVAVRTMGEFDPES
jgi:hypothetical protein